MFGKIQVAIAERAVPALKENQITVRKLVGRLRNSVYESVGVYEIRLRLYLWELSGMARQKKTKYGLDSAVAGKTAFLILASCFFAACAILMAWQSRDGVGQVAQTVSTAGFEPFHRPGHPAPGSMGGSRYAGFSGYELPRDPGRSTPAMRELTRHSFPAKSAIKAHTRIVCTSRD